MTGTINDITNLKFYTAKGYEIPMQKSYVLTWEFVPGKLASKYIQDTIKGYFIGDVDFSDPDNLKIKASTLETAFIKNGDFYIRFADKHLIDDNGIPVYSYDEADPLTNLLPAEEYYNYLFNLLFEEDNEIIVSINVKNKTYTHNFHVYEIFTLNENSNYEEYSVVKTVYTGENIGENKEFYQLVGLSKIDLMPLSSDPETSFIQQVFEESVPNIGIYFPFVRYIGDFYQDKISSDFIATDTLLVLEEVRNEDDTYSYVTPYITENSEYSLVFLPETNSELKIIDETSEYEIKYKDEASFAMANEQIIHLDIATPFSFAIAFQATTEGAYQNLLGIYLRSKEDDTEHVFFMGAISVKSEVEGEDERFRTLLANFGVPDPIQYSNIFAEQDYQEEGKDYELINKKSKELMLSYDAIFSYVGTYKALIRAIKFLGYQDIIFKEWYTIKDTNDKLTDIAVLVFDSSNGNFLKLKLADYGISIEDFNNYNKLNKISMIYHFNEQSDDVEKIKTTLCHYDASTGNIEVDNHRQFTFISEVPMTQPIYIYRNAEILTKLLAVKRWLEQHIIGVGAYIADITGEGIYFGWQKTQGYQTQHYLNDFSQEQYYTADVKQVSEFVDSSAIVSCTLNELNNAVRFIDYDETPIDAFDKYDISINLQTDDGTIDISVLSISNSIEAPVLGDEYEFDLVNRPNSGTLYEWSADSSNQILIQDGEIKFLFDKTKEAYIDSSCLPIITLENANIHNAYGNWRTNIKWLIRETIDPETGNTKYKLSNYKQYLSNSTLKIANQYIILEPVDTSTAWIKYSEKNKWDIPMLIVHGYKFANINFNTIDTSDGSINDHEYYNLEDENSDFILEIIKGDILFKNVDNCGCQISFSSDLIQSNYIVDQNNMYLNELQIQPEYTYHSDRMAFVNLDSSTIESEANTVINCTPSLTALSNEVTENINNLYNYNTLHIKQYNPGINEAGDTALIDASNYINNSSYIEALTEFIQAKQDALKKEILDTSLEQIINNNYTCNSSINVKVTRLGQYDLIARGFDKYNNMFPSKYDNKVDVTAAPIPMDTYISNSSSGNNESFYKLNIDGSLQDADQLNELIDNCENKIYYPKSYHIYDIDYNINKDYVEFDNISYALDTPKNNDIVTFDTLNERCINVLQISNNEYRLQMLDENPNKIFLYTDVSAITTKKVSVFVYEHLLKDFVYSVENCKVIDCSTIEQNEDINYESDSYIDISAIDCSLADYTNNDLYKLFVLNTTEYPLYYLDSSRCNIELNYDTKETYITYDCELFFNVEDVIKIRYYMDVSVSKMYFSSIGTFTQPRIYNGQIINETAYRIKDVSGGIINTSIDTETFEEYVYYQYTYTIDGLPNTNLLENENVHAVIMYAAQYPVKYATKVIGRSYEFNLTIGFNNYSILRDHFTFNSTLLFLKDYIDDTYGMEVTDYDYINGEKYWFDFTKYGADTSILSMYYYHQFPVTAELGYNIIFRSHDIDHKFLPDYKVDWKVSVESVDELDNIPENLNNRTKETWFRSINDYLTIKPYMLGSHDIELTCTDRYGNRLVNKGEGMLYIKLNTETNEYMNYGYV